jgi:hypothetical protein
MSTRVVLWIYNYEERNIKREEKTARNKKLMRIKEILYLPSNNALTPEGLVYSIARQVS